MGIEQMMRDVDPARVGASQAAKRRFMAEVDALPETRRCKGAPVNHDGSCFHCGDDQGEIATLPSPRRPRAGGWGGGVMGAQPPGNRELGCGYIICVAIACFTILQIANLLT